jgi:hypothetical protein
VMTSIFFWPLAFPAVGFWFWFDLRFRTMAEGSSCLLKGKACPATCGPCRTAS